LNDVIAESIVSMYKKDHIVNIENTDSKTTQTKPAVCYRPQPTSSLRSPQSLSASHCQIFNTHFPPVHRNSFGSHTNGFSTAIDPYTVIIILGRYIPRESKKDILYSCP